MMQDIEDRENPRGLGKTAVAVLDKIEGEEAKDGFVKTSHGK